MKIKAILRGNKLTFPMITVLKKPEVEVEVELPDEDVEVYTNEELERLPFDELVELVWKNAKYDEDINKNYKELIMEALEEKYK